MKDTTNKRCYQGMFDIADIKVILECGDKHKIVSGSIKQIKADITKARKDVKGILAVFYFPMSIDKTKQDRILNNFLNSIAINANVISHSERSRKYKNVMIDCILVF